MGKVYSLYDMQRISEAKQKCLDAALTGCVHYQSTYESARILMCAAYGRPLRGIALDVFVPADIIKRWIYTELDREIAALALEVYATQRGKDNGDK